MWSCGASTWLACQAWIPGTVGGAQRDVLRLMVRTGLRLAEECELTVFEVPWWTPDSGRLCEVLASAGGGEGRLVTLDLRAGRGGAGCG